MAKPYERLMVLDFETYWDSKEYTLSDMTTEEYVRDPRFKAWGVSYKWYGEQRAVWISHGNLQRFFDSVDWSTTAILCQNTAFDGSILAWHYGKVPCFYFDTLSMARAVRGVEAGNSLAKLADDMGLPPKGRAVHSTNGLTKLTFDIEQELAEYCKHDTWLCEEVYRRLRPGYPSAELRLIDMTLRMFIVPRLRLDTEMLQQALEEDTRKRTELLVKLGVEEAELASSDKFAELLTTLGVDPPTKVSKKTGKTAWAFAKNDALFQPLIASENEDVALLCEARLLTKSTQSRTRAQRFVDIAQRGTLPVPLAYWGAHTGRWAAQRGESINMQNLKRGSFLRRSVMAPPGYVVVVVDLSQIEPRVLAWLSGYEELLEIFRSGQDAYSMFGARMFGVPGLNKNDHPVLRQSAKSALLGCGYSMGWFSFAAQLLTGFLGAPPVRYDKDFIKQLGIGKDALETFLNDEKALAQALSIPRTCSDKEIVLHSVATKEIVTRYRAEAKPVTRFWKLLSQKLESSLVGGEEFEHKGLVFSKEKILLPNGMSLKYPDLRSTLDENDAQSWTYGPRRKKLYGGKLAENITQAVARIVMTDGMLRIQKRYPVVMTVHDEAVMVVPEHEGAEALEWSIEQMTQEPPYLPGIPLAAEGGVAVRYGEAK